MTQTTGSLFIISAPSGAGKSSLVKSLLAADPQVGVLVACGDGVLRVKELQKPGGKRLPAADFLRGMPIAAGSRFD